MRYARYYKARSERGRAMAMRRWDLDRQRRDAEEPMRARELAEQEALQPEVRAGDAIGVFEYRDLRSGEIRRWTVLLGPRTDQVRLRDSDGRTGRASGWTGILNGLRRKLVGKEGRMTCGGWRGGDGGQ